MEDERIECHSFTHARRHPKVLGVLMGYVLRWPLTGAQIGMLLGGAIVLVWTQKVWGVVVPPGLRFLVVIGLPIGGAVLLRYWLPEGRSPAKTALGYANFLLRPRHGSVDGRSLHAMRPVRLESGRIFVRETK